MGWFLDRKDPKTELEGLDRAQKILDERYQSADYKIRIKNFKKLIVSFTNNCRKSYC